MDEKIRNAKILIKDYSKKKKDEVLGLQSDTTGIDGGSGGVSPKT